MRMKIMYLIIMMIVTLNLTTWIFFVKQRLDELEHPALITEWKNNTDKDYYKKQAKGKN